MIDFSQGLGGQDLFNQLMEQQMMQQEQMRQQQLRNQQAYQPQPQQQTPGMSMPSTSMMDMFGGGGGETAAAGGGEGGMSGVLSNPWAWLAAAVVGNEIGQSKAGNRPESGGAHARELLTGEVLERDLERYFGGAGKVVGQLGNPAGTWDLIKGLF